MVPVGIIIVAAKNKCFLIWIVDVKFLYFQSDKSLVKKIFTSNPASRLELSHENYLELLRSIHGLADSGDEWNRDLDDNV